MPIRSLASGDRAVFDGLRDDVAAHDRHRRGRSRPSDGDDRLPTASHRGAGERVEVNSNRVKLGFVVSLIASLAAQIGLRGRSATRRAVTLPTRTLLLAATCAFPVASIVACAHIDRFVFDVRGNCHARAPVAYVVLIDNARSGERASDLALVISLLQTFLVGTVVYLLRDGRCTVPRIAIVAATMVAMLVVAGYDHNLKNADVYAYVGFAKLGMAAFHLPRELFTGDYETINRLRGNPLVPCPYGPL